MEKALTLLLSLVLLCSCGGKTDRSSDNQSDTIPLKYAHNLTLIQHDGWTEAILRNPWDTTQTLHRYEIRKPYRRLAVFTAVHCALIQELGMGDCIGGVCEPEYIKLPAIQQGLREGRIIDLGSGMDPSIEHIMDLQPDALMPSPFQNSNGYGRIEQLGIPIIECADYMEVSPLARAEWIRFYGRLLGVAERADSLFAQIESRYLQIQARAASVAHRPTVLIDRPYQGTWYAPGGQSTMGILYHDAGADYVFRDRPESGSLPLSMEAVLESGSEADYWMLRYNQPTPLTLSEMQTDNPAYAHFRAFRQGNVYGCNTAQVPFYEDTPFHPDLLLADLIQIFHPELGFSAEKHYFYRLK